MAMKYAVEHWRRAMPGGMGTLYWQIDDCWPVASWSSIDYHGRWKALQYMAKKFYAPILVSAVEDLESGRVQIHLTNDTLQPSAGSIVWRLTDAQGKSLARGKLNASIEPLKSQLVDTLDLGEHLRRYGPRQLILWIEYVVKGNRISSNLATFARPKHLELADPAIELEGVSLGDGTFVVTLTAAKPALWAWLELEGVDAKFSDNFMHLSPGGPQRVVVTPAKPLTLKQLNKALRVHSLVDTYQ
jgi:beta-mannosidase